MRAHDDELIGQHLEAAEDVEADGRVGLHLGELFIRQLARLLQHGVGHTDLADVVKAHATLETNPGSLVLRRVLHLARDHEGVLRHPLRVAGGVLVPRVYGIGQRPERGQDDFFAVFEQLSVVDDDRGLRGQFGDEVAMVVGEHATDLVVGEEKDAKRLVAQGDRHTQHRPRIERAVASGLSLHRLHERLLGRHDLIADVTAEPQRELFRGARVGAEAAPEDQPSRFPQGQAADLRRRCLGRTREHLLEHQVQVQGRGRRLKRLLQVLELPDAALVVVIQLGVADRDDSLVAQRRQNALVVLGPLARAHVEDAERPPHPSVLEHRRTQR